MKITLKILASVMVLASVLLISGCGGKDPVAPSVQDQQLTKLSSTWKVSSATLDGSPQTGYDQFTLTLSGTAGATSFGYSTGATSTRPANSPWPVSGNWTFGSDPLTQVIRDKGTDKQLDMTYSVSDTQLQLNFDFSGVGFPARVSSVKGKWVFTFTKQ